LGKVNVVTNTVMLFFTHRTFRTIFVESGDGVNKEFKIDTIGWDVLNFFMFLVAVEHLVFFFRLVVRSSSEVEPLFVKQGKMERAKLIK
jgi:hypothetical protein